MMTLIVGLLTVLLVIDCVLLILLVLIQLPKKDAGAGLAFGGAATDALFGAGSGNVLTKVTKYGTVAFFVLAMLLSVMQSRFYHGDTSEFQRKVDRAGKQLPAGQPAPGSTPAPLPALAPQASNAPTQPAPAPTNPPAPPN